MSNEQKISSFEDALRKSDKKKAEEMLKWLDLFDFLRCKVDNYAINNKTFNLGLKQEIENLRSECKKVI